MNPISSCKTAILSFLVVSGFIGESVSPNASASSSRNIKVWLRGNPLEFLGGNSAIPDILRWRAATLARISGMIGPLFFLKIITLGAV